MRVERQAGVSIDAISKKYDREPAMVSKICTGAKKQNSPGPLASPSRPRPISKAQEAEILQSLAVSKFYIGRVLSSGKLAKRFNVDVETAQRYKLRALANLDRFWGLVDRSGGTEACWPFRGPLLKRKTGNDSVGRWTTVQSYTGKKANVSAQRANRTAYQLTYGPLKPTDVLLHTGEPTCVACSNPLHHEIRAKGRKSRAIAAPAVPGVDRA
jgi:hypothetical protein